jgi:UDP-glucose 4-epimerase
MNNTELRIVVLFGATGTVGTYAAVALQKAGYSVVAVGRRKSDNGFFGDRGMRYVSMDIVDKDSYKALPQENVYAVVHLAGAIPARMQGYHPQIYIDSILTGTLNVLDYCVMVSADRIVFAQSVADVSYMYGDNVVIPADAPQHFPLNDDHSVYSICKNAAVNLIEHYYVKYGLKRFVLRFPNIYVYHPNPFYYFDGEKRWQSYRLLIERAKQGLPIELWGDPELQRDIVYVKDCVQIIEKSLSASVDGGMYNVGTGIGTSMRKQIEGIIEAFSTQDRCSRIIERPKKPDTASYIMDVSKTIKELGYIPQYDYLSYLRDMKIEMQTEPFEQLWGKGEDYFSGLLA